MRIAGINGQNNLLNKMEKNHKHNFINTCEYAGEYAGLDYYWWECSDCGHMIKVDDFGNTSSVTLSTSSSTSPSTTLLEDIDVIT